MSSIPRSGSSPLIIYPFEIHTPTPQEDLDADAYDLEALPNAPDPILPNVQKSQNPPQVSSSTLAPLMDKLRSLDKTIHHPNPQWIIRDIFLLLQRSDVHHLLATSKNIAYCIISDPILKDRFNFLFPPGINFEIQAKLYTLHTPDEHFMGLRILNPQFRPSLLTKIMRLFSTLTGFNKPESISKPVLDLEPKRMNVPDPQEIVWTISDLPVGTRIAKKPHFLRPIVLPPQKCIDSPKPLETVCTIHKRSTKKRRKPDYIRPLVFPPQRVPTDTTHKASDAPCAKKPKENVSKTKTRIPNSRDETIGHAPYNPSSCISASVLKTRKMQIKN